MTSGMCALFSVLSFYVVGEEWRVVRTFCVEIRTSGSTLSFFISCLGCVSVSVCVKCKTAVIFVLLRNKNSSDPSIHNCYCSRSRAATCFDRTEQPSSESVCAAETYSCFGSAAVTVVYCVLYKHNGDVTP